MLINNITKCCKPRRLYNFKGNEHSDNCNKKRYKHYEELSEDILRAKSILKAQKDVQNSNKMKLYKAMPAITTAALTTTIAITQPGKLSTKVKTGLGFLAIIGAVNTGMDFIKKIIDKKYENKEEGSQNALKKAVLTLGGCLGAGILASAGIKGIKKISKDTNFAKFLASEAKQAADEIDSSKLGKFFDEKINPFCKKHQKTIGFIAALAPVAALFSSIKVEDEMAKSLSDDVNKKAMQNYEKGKEIQRIARENFDAVDAIEV